MNQPDFERLQKELFNHCFNLTRQKGEDYTRGNADVLHHFKETAKSFGITPMQVCGIFMKKHFDAIFNYIKTGGKSESEPIDTRLQDAINYLTFMKALIIDEVDEQEGE